jgi:general stress protein 26
MSATGERERVRALVQRAGVAFLMTIDEDGAHVGRPMLPLLSNDDPHIYFLTHQQSRKTRQIAAHPQVGLTINSEGRYFVVTATASISRDPELLHRLWHPTYRAWFPDGKDDREAVALRLVVERIEYWEPPRSRIVRVAQAIRAIVTRRAADTPMKHIDGPLSLSSARATRMKKHR